MERLSQDIGVHCNLQYVHDALTEVCTKREHILHAAHESCAILYNASLQAIESIVVSQNVGDIFRESARLSDSLNDALLFNEDHLGRTFKVFFKLWICIETYVPEFRVPDGISSHDLSRHRYEVQEKLLCAV